MSALPKTVELPVQHRTTDNGDNIHLRATTANAKARTVELVWSTGAGVKRQGVLPDGSGFGPYVEELSMDPKAVDLTRLNAGAPLLNSHMRQALGDVIGVIVAGSAKIANGIGTAVAKFSERADAETYFQDVVSGVIRNVSVGYSVQEYEVTRKEGDLPVFKATRWTPVEVSAVPIGADAAAGFRSETGPGQCVISFPDALPSQNDAANGKNERNVAMSTANTAQPVTNGDGAAGTQNTENAQDNVREIGNVVRMANLPDAQTHIDHLTQTGADVTAAREYVFDQMAKNSMNMRHHATVGHSYDDPAVKARAMSEALAARYITDREVSEHAQHYMGASLVDMAREIVQANGQYRTGMSKDQIIRAGWGTSDFPDLLLGSGDRILQASYEAAQSAIKPACRERTARDFRDLHTIRRGEFSELEKVNEGGEVRYGTMTETKETFKVETYAKAFAITRQAIINDDLDAFADSAGEAGRASAQTEAKILYGLLSSNPTMNEDSKALFHTDHNNLAGAGSAIDVDSLGNARKALRNMTGLDGKTPINVPPSYLLVGPEKETEAEKVLASIAAAAVADVNPFSNKLQLLVEPRFGTSKSWYVLAAPGSVPIIQYAYLEGARGPQMYREDGFDVMGMKCRVSLDFGAGVTDWRGAYKNPGA